MWLHEDASAEVVHEVWKRGVDVGVNISCTASELMRWRKKVFGNTTNEIRVCQNHMKELTEKQSVVDVIQQIKNVDARMEELERMEEVYWHQRSKQNWIQDKKKDHQKANQMSREIVWKK